MLSVVSVPGIRVTVYEAPVVVLLSVSVDEIIIVLSEILYEVRVVVKKPVESADVVATVVTPSKNETKEFGEV